MAFQIISKKAPAVKFLFIKVSDKLVIFWDYPKRYWVMTKCHAWFNQDVFWDKIENKNVKQIIIWPGNDIDFQSDSDSDDDIYSGSSQFKTSRG